MAPLSTLRSSALCKYMYLNINWSFSKKMEACFTWEHLFMETRVKCWVSPEQHLSLPSIHPLFSPWWQKKKPFTKSLKKKKTSCKIQSCQNNSHISHSQPCRHARWLHWDSSKALNQADLGSNPISNTFDSGQVWSLTSYGPWGRKESDTTEET